MAEEKFKGIVLLVPSDGRRVDIEWAMSISHMGYPVGMNHATFVSKPTEQLKEIAKAQGKFSTRDMQRETLVEKALGIGAPYIMFIDDDTLCPPETIQELFFVMQQHKRAGIVGGIYCTKEVPPSPIVFKEIGAGPHWDWTVGDVFQCAGLGTGCMLIRSDVFRAIPKPWFLDHAKSESGPVEDFNGVPMRMVGKSGTDDIYMCEKASKAGFEIWAHGGILPVHIGQDDKRYVLPRNSFPILSYVERLKEQEDKASKQIVEGFQAIEDETKN